MAYVYWMSIRIYLLLLLIESWEDEGSTNPEERGLTDIEKALVEDFNQIILERVV